MRLARIGDRPVLLVEDGIGQLRNPTVSALIGVASRRTR